MASVRFEKARCCHLLVAVELDIKPRSVPLDTATGMSRRVGKTIELVDKDG